MWIIFLPFGKTISIIQVCMGSGPLLKIKTGFNAALGTDTLSWATTKKISDRTIMPFMKAFLETSPIEVNLQQLFHTLNRC